MPVGLRLRGDRQAGGRAAARADYTAVKQARLAERAQQEARLRAAAAELAAHAGPLSDLRVSDEARSAFLDLYAAALTRAGRPLGPTDTARAELRTSVTSLTLDVRREPGATVRLRSPAGTLVLRDLAIELSTAEAAEAQIRRVEA